MNDTRDRLVRKGDYIQGSFVRPEQVDGYINGVNPGDRSDVLGRFPFSEAAVDDAVENARIGARVWRRVGLNDRAAALRRFRAALSKNADRIVPLITRETGRPLWDARLELEDTNRALDAVVEAAQTMLAPQLNGARRLDLCPRGVVGFVFPHVQPCLQPAVGTASALIAGNTVVYKPSKFTPGVGQLVAEVWDQCRLPRGVLNMVQGSGAGVGRKLSTHPDIDALVVMGSLATSGEVRRATFERPELPVLTATGGKAVALVLEGCELDRAVHDVVVGAFSAAGQRADSTARVIVQASIFDAFVARLLNQVSLLRVGYGFDDGTFMGPLISEALRGRFRKTSRALEAAGHPTLLEGSFTARTERRGFYATPSVHEVRWGEGNAFLGEEPPGPMLLLYRVDSVDEALALHNQVHARSVCSVFPPAGANLPDLADRLRTGVVLVNQPTTSRAFPLGGGALGRASNGLASGTDLLRFLSYSRACLTEGAAFDPASTPGLNWGGLPEVEADLSSELEPIN